MSRFVLKLLLRYKIQFYCGLILSIFLAIFSVVISSLAGPSIKILTNQTPQLISWKSLFGEYLGHVISRTAGVEAIQSTLLMSKLPFFLVTFAFLKAISTALQWSLFENLGEKASRDIRYDIGQNFIHSSYESLHISTQQEKAFDEQLASAVGNDTRFLREYIVHFWGGLPREGLQTLLQGLFLIFLSPKLFLFFLIALIPIALILAHLGKKIRKRVRRMLTDFSSLTEWLQQRLLGFETIKQFRTEALEEKKFDELSYNLSQRALATDRVKARTSPLVELMGLLGFSAVLMLALHFSNRSEIPGSVLLSFFTALALFAQAIGNLGRYYNSNREAKEAVARVYNLLTSLKKTRTLDQLSTIQAHQSVAIKIENLKFSFGRKLIFENFSKVLSGGKIYGISGPSGVGKSTLMKIFLGLLEPQAGTVAFFSSQIDSYPIAYVPQSLTALDGSIAENISYPHFNSNEDAMLIALEHVKMLDFVTNLPQGLNTPMFEAGFSGGQLQRIFFARIFYLSSSFIFIDEGTSAQDPANEQFILDTLLGLKNAGRCIVMIAHREKVKNFCDELIQLKGIS